MIAVKVKKDIVENNIVKSTIENTTNEVKKARKRLSDKQGNRTKKPKKTNATKNQSATSKKTTSRKRKGRRNVSVECKYCGKKYKNIKGHEESCSVAYSKILELKKMNSKYVEIIAKEIHTRACWGNFPPEISILRSRFRKMLINFLQWANDYVLVFFEEFVKYLKNRKISLKDINRIDEHYKKFLQIQINVETLDSAFSRFEEYAKRNGFNTAKEMLENLGSNRIYFMLETGLLSPWILFATEEGRDALLNLDEEAANLLDRRYGIKLWISKVRENLKFSNVKKAIKEYGFTPASHE